MWGLGALELHGGGESMRGMNRVGDGVEETVGWDNRRRLCSQSLSPRPDTQSYAHFMFKDDGVSVVSRSGIFKWIRNSRCRVSDQFRELFDLSICLVDLCANIIFIPVAVLIANDVMEW